MGGAAGADGHGPALQENLAESSRGYPDWAATLSFRQGHHRVDSAEKTSATQQTQSQGANPSQAAVKKCSGGNPINANSLAKINT